MARAAKLGRAVAGRWELSRGEERLENWANWSLSFSSRLDYPRAAPWARLYKPDAGDIWEGIEADQVKAPVDEDDAALIEAFVRTLSAMHKTAVRAHYLGKLNSTMGAKRVGLSRMQYVALLDQVARWAAAA